MTTSNENSIHRPHPFASPRRLLGVWAHPDDEAYLSAAMMARVTDSGGSVTVVTATRGEQGTSDPALRGTAAFGALREAELRASLADLGVTDVRVLGLPDGGLPEVEADEPVAAIAATIAEVDPDVVVTFGPDGITWHPDHRTICEWTTRACAASGRTSELLYAAMTDDFAVRHESRHARAGLFADWGPGRPATTPRRDLALECAMTPGELARKRRALGRHASQIGGVLGAFGEQGYLEWLHQETFRRPTAVELEVGALR
jgi:LmbE family N-acetylglucosaminyl deacetylase